MKAFFSHKYSPALLLVAIGLIVRWFAVSIGYIFESDVFTFQYWASQLYNDGLSNFYISEGFTDYPPMYMYVLYLVGMMRSWFEWEFLSPAFNRAVFMPSMLCDLGIGFLIYTYSIEKRFDRNMALLFSGVWVFNPAVILNSAIWGQVDSVFTLILFISLLMLMQKKLYASYILFGIAILTKPQSIFIGPVYLYSAYTFLQAHRFTSDAFIKIGARIAAALSCMVLFVLPFTQGFNLSPIINEYRTTLESYPFAAINAYNFYALTNGNWKPLTENLLGISYSVWGFWAIVFIVITSLIALYKTKENTFLIAGSLVVLVFMFSIKMHERYLFPAILFLLLAYVQNKDKRMLGLYAAFSCTFFVNCFDVLRMYKNNLGLTAIQDSLILFSLVNVMLTVYLIYVMVSFVYLNVKTADDEQETLVIEPISEPPIMSRRDYVLIITLTIVYGLLAFYKLGDTKAPQTTWIPQENEVVLIDFGEVKNVHKFQFLMGARHDRSFELLASLDGEEWFYDYDFDESSVFAWRELDLFIHARYFLLRPYGMTGLRIQEAAFYDMRGNLIPIVWHTPEAAHLFDEQHLVPEYVDYMSSSYFDEIYHARTGYEFVHGLQVYENTHPPLGKNFIALSVKIFGMTPFAWRLPGTLFGVLMVPLIYLLARYLFNSNNWAFFASLIFTFDFMHFAQTRIATIDTYVVFFIMAMYLCMFLYIKRDKQIFLCLCGIGMGLAIASKWQGVYGAMGLPLLFFPHWFKSYIRNNKQAILTLAACLLWFVAIPVVIYGLSYIPFVNTSGGGIQTIIYNQRDMFNYHSALEAEHPFSSAWWEWPFNKQPIWFYVNYVSADIRQGISSFGNPAVWWLGIAAVIYAIISLFTGKREYILLFLLTALAAQYLPWVMVSRTTFIYHYFPSIPFMVLLITYFFQKRAVKIPWVYAYGTVVVALFFLFYPVISGMPVSVAFVDTYLRWLPDWLFM